jgi:hypothetical protein
LNLEHAHFKLQIGSRPKEKKIMKEQRKTRSNISETCWDETRQGRWFVRRDGEQQQPELQWSCPCETKIQVSPGVRSGAAIWVYWGSAWALQGLK